MRLAIIAALWALFSMSAFAADPIRLVIHDHKFEPDHLDVPAGVKFKMIVKNEGEETAEWESAELDREEVVKAGNEVTIFLGPLSPGEYPFYDDRHQETKGVLVAK